VLDDDIEKVGRRAAADASLVNPNKQAGHKDLLKYGL